LQNDVGETTPLLRHGGPGELRKSQVGGLSFAQKEVPATLAIHQLPVKKHPVFKSIHLSKRYGPGTKVLAHTEMRESLISDSPLLEYIFHNFPVQRAA